MSSITSCARRLLLPLIACLGLLAAAAPALAGTLVNYVSRAGTGSIVVDTRARQLYLILGHGQAMRYPVGVGRLGKQWAGVSRIAGRYAEPNWAPPAAIRRDSPDLPALIPGGHPSNPMGAAAMTLAGGDYAIHGTNNPGSIGGFVSYGCIRMRNEDILDLMARVQVGTVVEVRL